MTPVLPAEPAWQTNLPFPPSASAAMDERRAYVPLEGEHFAAIDRETGALLWTVDIESAWPPLVRDGVVYLAASDEVHALDAETGQHVWRMDLNRGAMSPMAMTRQALIVLGAPDEVWAINPADGSRLWVSPLGGRTGRASMSIGSDAIYVAIVDRLYRVNAADGAVQWAVTLPGELTSTAVARDRVFVGSTSNELYAIDPERGRLAWKFRVGGDIVGVAATDDFVYLVSLDNMIRALNRGNGNQVWKRALTTRPVAAPQLFEGAVAVVNAESVATFSSKTGMPIGTYDSPNLLQGQPLVDSSPRPFTVSIVAVTRDGRAFGLRPVEMMFKEAAVQPLTTLPGRPLQKEVSPLP